MNPGLRARSHRESAARSLGRLCGPRAAALLSPKAELARGVSTAEQGATGGQTRRGRSCRCPHCRPPSPRRRPCRGLRPACPVKAASPPAAAHERRGPPLLGGWLVPRGPWPCGRAPRTRGPPRRPPSPPTRTSQTCAPSEPTVAGGSRHSTAAEQSWSPNRMSTTARPARGTRCLTEQRASVCGHIPRRPQPSAGRPQALRPRGAGRGREPRFSRGPFASPVLVPRSPPGRPPPQTAPGPSSPTSRTPNHTFTSSVLHPEDPRDNMQETSGLWEGR